MVYSSGKPEVYGGTSAGTPAFAGIIALLNQYLVTTGAQSVAGVGNVNPRLYALAQTTPSAFHDVLQGDNIVSVKCSGRSRGCVSGSYGYPAAPGYDQATGLGSVDAYNLVMAWRGTQTAYTRGSVSVALSSTANTVPSGGSVVITVKVTSADGGTPGGTVTLAAGGSQLSSAPLSGAGATSTANFTLDAGTLQAAGNTITAQYSGDGSYNSATSSITITVAGSGAPVVNGLANAASFQQTYAPGMILSIFGSNLADSRTMASSVPLPFSLAGVTVTIAGVSAPLYYASPGQLNVQIPFETPLNQLATVVVNNNGRTASKTISIGSAAPGLFTDSSGAIVAAGNAVRNQTIWLYMTGGGPFSPAIPTGSSPAQGSSVFELPRPVQGAVVTIGGLNAPIQFIGIPPGLVGVTQINVLVGSNTPLGQQSVVVRVGATSSLSTLVTVTAR